MKTHCCRCKILLPAEKREWLDDFRVACDHEECSMDNPAAIYCKHCENWFVEFNPRYLVCFNCAEGYYSDCPECGDRTAHDDMVRSRSAPIGPCKSKCAKKTAKQ
jgi:hypothetical protein